ncbi:transcriptional regulator [Stutzerimonas stutzeri]
MTYNWSLMLRLLQEAQKPGNEPFTPRQYAEEHAVALEDGGQPMPNLDSLKADAQNYESLLFEGGFIVSRPEEQGGNGENFILTERGQRLLDILQERGADVGLRQRLDDKGQAALVPEVFDELTR